MYKQLNSWLDNYRDVAFDLIRIYLGIGLLARGLFFLINAESFVALLPVDTPNWLLYDWVHFLVAWIHIIGGFAITVGFWTRIAALIQIPILFGAVFLSLGSLFSASQSFELSSLVLFILILVMICGSGHWSLDRLFSSSQTSIQKFLSGLNPLRSYAFDLLRMYLGFGLLVRGILFIADSSHFLDLIGTSSFGMLRSTFVLHYVALSHLLGGFMLLSGLLSRIGALIQLPILIGAVFVEEMSGGLTAGTQGFEIAMLVLFLLVLMVLYGSGTISSDYYLFHETSTFVDEPIIAPQTAEILSQNAPEESTFSDPVETLAVAETFSPEDSIDEIMKNPTIVAQAQYSFWGWCMFQINITPHPKEILFKDVHTGEIVRRSKDPRVLQRFKYR
ncbi:MAG: DoxX family protein [Bacteroidetes bacterium]|nr:DoxX family protein [Bacteroidota bacterium]MCY4225120.1 DoxX family protein [Bacteroidota bacterium]